MEHGPAQFCSGVHLQLLQDEKGGNRSWNWKLLRERFLPGANVGERGREKDE